jgi:hypothetical protein
MTCSPRSTIAQRRSLVSAPIFLVSGQRKETPSTTAIVPIPPATTESRGPNAAAVNPDSSAPVTLYQLWPVDVGGKPATLVWRGDMISSSEVADLRGVERLGAESAMIKDVAKSVRLFRRDTGGSR